MGNFFRDEPGILLNLRNIDLADVIRLKERGFADQREHDYAPRNVEDALHSYEMVLDLVGTLAADFIEPRAAAVDEAGVQLVDGCVRYAAGTLESLKKLSQAELMGFTLPRRYGGLNLPTVVYSAAIEMISRADASLMTIFGLQDIAETINDFASEEVKSRYLPRFARGEVLGAMVLTEPDAGSDLQAAVVRATEDKQNGVWRLDGVKRFISNGCGQVLLVLARSEPGTRDGRGLSLFLCERDDTVKIGRVENKLGIKGSPTCELRFNRTPAVLIGERKRGLIRYVMSLMNGARVGIAAQSVGIAQAAFVEATKFAGAREQFGKRINDIPAVREMLSRMRVNIEAARALVYEGAKMMDLEKELDKPEAADVLGTTREEVRKRASASSKYAAMLTPMAKHFASEMCVQATSDAIQIHGGSGYMKDYKVERYFRDARITTIYEGTTQLQVVASIRGIMSGVLEQYASELLGGLKGKAKEDDLDEVRRGLDVARDCISYLRGQDVAYQDLQARAMAEMCMDLVNSLLLLRLSGLGEHRQTVARAYMTEAAWRRLSLSARIKSGDRQVLDVRRQQK